MSRCPDDLFLESLALDTAPPTQRRRWAEHMEACSRCRRRLKRLRGSVGRFERRKPAGSLDKARLRARLWLIGALGMAAMGLVAVRVSDFFAQRQQAASVSAPATDPGFALMLERGGVWRRWNPEDELGLGDGLSLAMNPGARSFGLVAAVDRRGAVSVYYPLNSDRSGSLPPGKWTTSPGVIRMDGRKGWERLYALFSEKPISAEQVSAAVKRVGDLRSASRLPMPSGVAQESAFLFLTGEPKPGP